MEVNSGLSQGAILLTIKSWKFILVLPFLAAYLVLLTGSSSSEPVIPDEAKTAIVDQASVLKPDPDFIEKATGCLLNLGLPVDYFQGDEITVDFYRRLAESGYKIIVFRAHSGLMSNDKKTEQKTCLFTNQPYSRTDCIVDQLSSRVGEAKLDNYPSQFSIDGDFIENCSPAQFNQTVIIMMGCSSLEKDDLARAFIKKGASIYIGWNESVGLYYVENATLTLLDYLSQGNISLGSGVKTTMQEIGQDRVSGAELRYYPDQKGEATLAELLK
jgi:hypothetical protein